jgi:hypothetical protein
MKRTKTVEAPTEIITVCYTELIPDDMLREIFLFVFPSDTIQNCWHSMKELFRARRICKRIGKMLDNEIISKITCIGEEVESSIDDNTLSHLKGLTYLVINKSNTPFITDAGLMRMNNLEHLELVGELSDITASSVTLLTNLRELVICENSLPGNSLTTLKKLEYLVLHDALTFDNDSLVALTQLKKLSLTCDGEITADALSQLTQIHSLTLYEDDHDDSIHAALSTMTSLTSLSLDNWSMLDNNMLSSLTRLSVFDARCITADTIKPFMSTLTTISLKCYSSLDWSCLSMCPQLSTIYALHYDQLNTGLSQAEFEKQTGVQYFHCHVWDGLEGNL